MTAEATPSAVAIHVTDTGIGIPEDQLARIFDEFMQVDQTLARRQGGTGLGLAIASRLARLMGGEISVSSVRGQRIPIYADAAARPRTARRRETFQDCQRAAETVDDIRREAYAPLARQAAITVLIVEDNEDNLFTLREMLAPLSFDIATATTGRQAIDYCRKQMPDLVIMDVQMPGMSGLQATGRDPRASGRRGRADPRSDGPGDEGRPRTDPGRGCRRVPGQAGGAAGVARGRDASDRAAASRRRDSGHPAWAWAWPWPWRRRRRSGAHTPRR